MRIIFTLLMEKFTFRIEITVRELKSREGFTEIRRCDIYGRNLGHKIQKEETDVSFPFPERIAPKPIRVKKAGKHGKVKIKNRFKFKCRFSSFGRAPVWRKVISDQ